MFIASFAVHKLLNLTRSLLFIFVIIFITLEGGFKKILQKQKQKDIAMPMWEAQEMWVRSLSWEDPLKRKMATHFSILAWKIPSTEEPGRLPSMGPQRVGHD